MKKILITLLAFIAFSSNAAVIKLDFSEPFVNYGNQFESGVVEAINGGQTLSMFGNNWVAFQGSYTIDADTVLEITFSSSQIGELHGIGFDNDDVFDTNVDFRNGANRYFQFAGSQTFGVQDYNTYSAVNSVEVFSVEVGKFLTGNYKYLVFINDQDTDGEDAQSSFSVATTDTGFAQVSEPGALALMLMSFSLVSISRKRKSKSA